MRDRAILGSVLPRSKRKIRKIPHSGQEGTYSVEYISNQWYDAEAGQSRNEKHIIGVVMSDYPMAMERELNIDQYNLDLNSLKTHKMTQ